MSHMTRQPYSGISQAAAPAAMRNPKADAATETVMAIEEFPEAAQWSRMAVISIGASAPTEMPIKKHMTTFAANVGIMAQQLVEAKLKVARRYIRLLPMRGERYFTATAPAVAPISPAAGSSEAAEGSSPYSLRIPGSTNPRVEVLETSTARAAARANACSLGCFAISLGAARIGGAVDTIMSKPANATADNHSSGIDERAIPRI